MNNKAHGLQCEKIQSEEQQAQSVEMKFSEFGVDQNFFETYGGIITSIDRNGRNGYLRMKGSYKSSPPIRIHEDSGDNGMWFETMKVGTHVSFKATLNWTGTQWIAQKLIEDRYAMEGSKQKPKSVQEFRRYEVQEYYDEEVAPGMSRRPKPRLCPHYALGKCFRGRDCRFRHEEPACEEIEGKESVRALHERAMRNRQDQEEKASWALQDKDPYEALDDDRWVTVDRRGLCRFFSLGHCKKGNDCDFRHEAPTRKGDGKGSQDEPKRMCKFFCWGGCKKGDECEFSHDDQGAKEDGTFWQMQHPIVHPWKPGDWECHECRNHNFAKNESCKMCDRRGVQVPRPSRETPQTEGEQKRWLKVQEKHAAVVLTYLCAKCTADGVTPGCPACKANTETVNT